MPTLAKRIEENTETWRALQLELKPEAHPGSGKGGRATAQRGEVAPASIAAVVVPRAGIPRNPLKVNKNKPKPSSSQTFQKVFELKPCKCIGAVEGSES